MKHIARSVLFTAPGGILGERYECSCGAYSSAGECARGTPGPERALFGGRICRAVVELHRSEREEVTWDDATDKLVITPDALDRAGPS